jgi:hypothetical protein
MQSVYIGSGRSTRSLKHYFVGHNFCLYTVFTGGQDSPVGVATRHRLDGPETESRPDQPRGPPSLLYEYRVSPRCKAAGVWF